MENELNEARAALAELLEQMWPDPRAKTSDACPLGEAFWRELAEREERYQQARRQYSSRTNP